MDKPDTKNMTPTKFKGFTIYTSPELQKVLIDVFSSNTIMQKNVEALKTLIEKNYIVFGYSKKSLFSKIMNKVYPLRKTFDSECLFLPKANKIVIVANKVMDESNLKIYKPDLLVDIFLHEFSHFIAKNFRKEFSGVVYQSYFKFMAAVIAYLFGVKNFSYFKSRHLNLLVKLIIKREVKKLTIKKVMKLYSNNVTKHFISNSVYSKEEIEKRWKELQNALALYVTQGDSFVFVYSNIKQKSPYIHEAIVSGYKVLGLAPQYYANNILVQEYLFPSEVLANLWQGGKELSLVSPLIQFTSRKL